MGSILPSLLQKRTHLLTLWPEYSRIDELPDEKRAGLVVVIRQRSEANKN